MWYFSLEHQWNQPRVWLIDENTIFRATGNGDEADSMAFFQLLNLGKQGSTLPPITPL
jgi:hypothetical protein